MKWDCSFRENSNSLLHFITLHLQSIRPLRCSSVNHSGIYSSTPFLYRVMHHPFILALASSNTTYRPINPPWATLTYFCVWICFMIRFTFTPPPLSGSSPLSSSTTVLHRRRCCVPVRWLGGPRMGAPELVPARPGQDCSCPRPSSKQKQQTSAVVWWKWADYWFWSIEFQTGTTIYWYNGSHSPGFILFSLCASSGLLLRLDH